MGVESISIPPNLARVITAAGQRSGVDFDYLVQTAMRESSLNPNARAQSSSAVGLFQFLESTWLQVVKEEGPRLGYGDIAQNITRTPSGDYVVADRQMRQDILAMREDPQMAADMAAAFTRINGDYLYERFGRRPSSGELYIAHFLGASGAEQLFQAGLQNPDAIATRIFPRQAAANPSIFYENGQPRTIRELYRALVSRHESTGASPAFVTQQIASEAQTGATPQQQAQAPLIPSRYAPQNVSFTGLFRNAEPTLASTGTLPPLPLPGEAAAPEPYEPLFTGLYR